MHFLEDRRLGAGTSVLEVKQTMFHAGAGKFGLYADCCFLFPREC